MKILFVLLVSVFLNCIPRQSCGGSISINGTPMVQGSIEYSSYECLVGEEQDKAYIQKRDPRSIPEKHLVSFVADRTVSTPDYSMIVEKDGAVIARASSDEYASGYSSYSGFYTVLTALVENKYSPPFDVRVVNNTTNHHIDFTIEPLNP